MATLLLAVAVTSSAGAVPPEELPATWVEPAAGVSNPDPNAVTASLAEEAGVWDIEVIGNTVYVAGTFTRVTEKFNGTDHTQRYVAAFDATSGDWIDWWVPQLDGPAYALDTTSDGSLLVGGEFTSVDGNSNAAGLVSLDPRLGTIDSRFVATVERRWTSDPHIVRDISTTGNRVYVAGNFNHVNGTRVYKTARLDRRTGALDSSFRPQVAGRSAHGIAESADGQRVHIGGWFTSVGGEADTETLTTVQASNGATLSSWNNGLPIQPHPWAWSPTGGIVLDVDVYGNNLYVAGAEHFWIRMSSTTGSILQNYPSRHDTQSVNITDDRVFIGCHCRLTPEFWSYQIDAASGTIVDTYTDGWTGDDGSWAVAVAPDKCVWTGGGLDSAPLADGSPTWLGDLARSCPPTGPVPHNVPSLVRPGDDDPGGGGFTCEVTANPNGSVTVSWDDLGASGYDLSEDGGAAVWVTGTSRVDFTPGTDYSLVAWGNGRSGTMTSCTNPDPGGGGPGFSCQVAENPNGSVTVSWDDIGASGYDLSEDGGAAVWVTGTSRVDLSPGTEYRVVAWGNGVSGTSTTCTNPNPGGGGPGFSCQVAANPNGSVTVSWDDLGANGYDLREDGGAAVWVTGTSRVDSTPGTEYEVVAWGAGVSGTSTTCQN